MLYIGDVMGEVGLALVASILPPLRREMNVDYVIAQAENVTNGKGINPEDFTQLKKVGVDFCTGGNHILEDASIYPQLTDPKQPIIRPANYPTNMPGLGWKHLITSNGKILVISLLGQIVGRGVGFEPSNPLKVVDMLLAEHQSVDTVATIVNFHGDFSSEKVVIGQYLDGKVSAVIGDHWHVPTADARILPGGTAHITDVGMVGALNSSLGVQTNTIIERWRNGISNRNILETEGPLQFNAVLVNIDLETGLATSIEQIQIIR